MLTTLLLLSRVDYNGAHITTTLRRCVEKGKHRGKGIGNEGLRQPDEEGWGWNEVARNGDNGERLVRGNE